MWVPPRVGPETGLTDVAWGLPYCSKVCMLAENCWPLRVTSSTCEPTASGLTVVPFTSYSKGDLHASEVPLSIADAGMRMPPNEQK